MPEISMLLEINSAKYFGGYRVFLVFNNGYEAEVDLKKTLFNEGRKIFKPLRKKEYFGNFSIKFNTICWENEADFAPEFLYGLAKKQASKLVLANNEPAEAETDLATA